MRWIFFSIAALVSWGLWGLMAKAALVDLDWRLLVVFAIPGYFIPLAVVFGRNEIAQLARPRSYQGVTIGILAFVSLAAFYKALETGDASVVVPIMALYPALVLIGAVVFLKESITRYQLLGIILALAAGVLLASG